MIVQELIDALATLPPDLEVVAYAGDSWDCDYQDQSRIPEVIVVAQDDDGIHDCTFDSRPNQYEVVVL
jgi:hypothetical protein